MESLTWLWRAVAVPWRFLSALLKLFAYLLQLAMVLRIIHHCTFILAYVIVTLHMFLAGFLVVVVRTLTIVTFRTEFIAMFGLFVTMAIAVSCHRVASLGELRPRINNLLHLL